MLLLYATKLKIIFSPKVLLLPLHIIATCNTFSDSRGILESTPIERVRPHKPVLFNPRNRTILVISCLISEDFSSQETVSIPP